MATLDDAIALAVSAHRGHSYPTDAIGRDPFILHPLRVMLAVVTPVERQVAVLHDVVEESDVSLDELRRLGFSDEVVEAVDHLTHRDSELYEDYIERVATSPLARAVKLADLRDNLAQNHGFPGGEKIAARHQAALARLS